MFIGFASFKLGCFDFACWEYYHSIVRLGIIHKTTIEMKGNLTKKEDNLKKRITSKIEVGL